MNMIDECRVKVTSKEQFRRVEEVCFKNDLGWYQGNKEHMNYFCDYIDALYIKIDTSLTYTSTIEIDDSFIEYEEFIRKYDKPEHNTKTIKPGYVKISSEEEFRKVQDICFKNNVYWGAGGKSYILMYEGIKLIHINKGSPCTLSHTNDLKHPHISFNEFVSKYEVNNVTKKYRIKTKKEFIDEYGEYWRNRDKKCCFTDSMDYLLGKEITDEIAKQLLSGESGRIDDWWITKSMIIECKSTGIKQKILSIISPKKESIRLRDSLYKTKKPNLNQDNTTEVL